MNFPEPNLDRTQTELGGPKPNLDRTALTRVVFSPGGGDGVFQPNCGSEAAVQKLTTPTSAFGQKRSHADRRSPDRRPGLRTSLFVRTQAAEGLVKPVDHELAVRVHGQLESELDLNPGRT